MLYVSVGVNEGEGSWLVCLDVLPVQRESDCRGLPVHTLDLPCTRCNPGALLSAISGTTGILATPWHHTKEEALREPQLEGRVCFVPRTCDPGQYIEAGVQALWQAGGVWRTFTFEQCMLSAWPCRGSFLSREPGIVPEHHWIWPQALCTPEQE